MKVLSVSFLAVVLSGCFFASSPTVLDLRDEAGQVVGQAFAVDNHTFVTADHVFATHGPLFYEDRLLTVLARQGNQDYMEFSLPSEAIAAFNIARFSETIPAVGSVVYWPDGAGTVEALDQSIDINARNYEGLMVITGQVAAGESGSPVYDSKNKVIGLIVGGTSTQVFVRPYNR